jgi:serine/threonine protein kinase
MNLIEEDLITTVEYFKEGLVAYSTGAETTFSSEDYKKIRKVLLNAKHLEALIPNFLKKYRNLEEFWGFIKTQSSTYAGRRQFLGEIFNPLIDYLETDNSEVISDYQEEGVIGAGGFGQVIKFRHNLLDMPFAFKFYSPIFSNDGERNLERFFKEAKILFKLLHPSIIQIYDVGLMNGKPYIRMEYFEGKNLNEVLKDRGRFPLDKAINIMKEVSNAIEYAHSIGVVHRDIRPSNIMIARPQQVRIIDFGLGILIENEITSRLTKTGQHIAGGHYTAPELLTNPKLIDPRTDIYSIGAVWYTLVTGQAPAGSSIRDVLLEVDGITQGYADIILKCLESISRRYYSVAELKKEIENLRTMELWF